MTLYLDLATSRLVQVVGNSSPLSEGPDGYKRGVQVPVRIIFLSPDDISQPVLLPIGAVIRHGLKLLGEYEGEFQAFTDEFERPAMEPLPDAEPDAFAYTGSLNCATDELNELFKTPNANLDDDEPSVTLNTVLSWRVPGADKADVANVLSVTVLNSNDTGNEGVPTTAGPNIGDQIAALEASLAALSGTPPDVQVFTADGTWAKPAGAKLVKVYIWGGGGGGGSGRRGAAGTARGGGGGGGAGSYINADVLPSALGSSVSVYIGSGGTGAAARTTNDTSGAAGGFGGNTIFGNFTARAGNSGAAGTTTGGNGGSAETSGSFTGGIAGTAGAGGAGSASSTATMAPTDSFLPAGGGGGGGIGSSNTASAGSPGAKVGNTYIGSHTAATAGAAGGGAGANGTTSTISGFGGGGAGGGGGAADASLPGGTGGNGGNYGAGGGGGGASANGANSGAGGNGAPGLAIIVTLF